MWGEGGGFACLDKQAEPSQSEQQASYENGEKVAGDTTRAQRHAYSVRVMQSCQ